MEGISAFDVYLVMQLDSIRGGIGVLCFLSVSGLCIAAVDGERLSLRWWASLAGTVVAAVVCTFTPSSKTAAAMIVLPAITSEQVTEPVAAEAKELYALAKRALTNIAEPPAKPEKSD